MALKIWLLSTILLNSTLVMANSVEKYRGDASKDGQLVYQEFHEVTFNKDGKVLRARTEYKKPNGELMARLQSDFTTSLTAPEHQFEDFRFKHKHGIRKLDNKVQLYSQDDGEPEKTKILDSETSKDRVLFGCQGLHYYLRENFEKALAQKTLPISLLTPGNLNFYNFELNYLGEKSGLVNLEIEIDNFFLKLFAPKLEVLYDPKTKRLMRYNGLSNIFDDREKNQSVEIKYFYDLEPKA